MIISVTGYHGAGKTTTAVMFGFKVISADKIGRKVFNLKKKDIKRLLGTLNKKKIREIIFSDRKLLLRFNRIIHGLLVRKIEEKIKKNKNKKLVIDAALYYDLKLGKLCDKVVLVERSVGKVARSLNETEAEIMKIMANQKIPKKADFVAVNNGSKAELRKKVKRIKGKLKI